MLLDPVTATAYAVGKFLDFLCTPVGQKIADKVFADGEAARQWFEARLGHTGIIPKSS